MRHRLLVVDDEREWLQMLGTRLQHGGYDIDVACDAVQATMQAVRVKPDLMLLDIMMPAGGGLEVLKNVRANANTRVMPVIVMTARSDQGTRDAAYALGISGYFIKTGSTNDLLAKIRRVLGE